MWETMQELNNKELTEARSNFLEVIFRIKLPIFKSAQEGLH